MPRRPRWKDDLDAWRSELQRELAAPEVHEHDEKQAPSRMGCGR